MSDRTLRILKISTLIAIPLISLIMHFKHLDKDLISIHVWRQTCTQNTSLNFYQEDFNIMNPRVSARGNTNGIFRMEFPLMQWINAALFKIFGPIPLVTRLFMFVVGLFSILGIYFLLKYLLKQELPALAGAWAFTFSPSFYYYTINPGPDQFALCCGIWGLTFFFKFIQKPQILNATLSAIFLALGTLSKLPFILFFAVPGVCFLQCLFTRPIPVRKLLLCAGILLFLLFPLLWYIPLISTWHGNGVTTGIFDNPIPFSQYLSYVWGNLVSTLPELLLNYGSVPLFLAGIFFLLKNKLWKRKEFHQLMWPGIAVMLYFLYELNVLGMVHDYYLFPFYPFLFIIVAYGAGKLFSLKRKFFRYAVLVLLVILPLTAYLRMQDRWDINNPGFNKDLMTHANELKQAVPDQSLCVMGNDFSNCIWFYYLDKKGWGFHNDSTHYDTFGTMVAKGAEYLYSDSRIFEERPEVAVFLDSLIMQKGSIRLYHLKRNQQADTTSSPQHSPCCNQTTE